LGRYDVVGVLATRRSPGGSTVVIAKAAKAAASEGALGSNLALSYSPLAPNEGTTTFEKAVAIKIIAPELVREPHRLEPFLSTARAVIAVKHSSIAQLYEVGQAGDDVFLVMDYVAGETAASLMRQLHSVGETLDYKLAAHIVAEAAGGLEAAHAAGILHEQLTPHDLFVGYDGSVRVLDIGIAAARSWLAGETGEIGVGIEYSSPERCKKEPLDRRTDIFSLGTMLWELNTGISPFERAKKADTVRAICEENILPPHNVVPGLPEVVSVVTMKALERDKEERYPTALALRQALIGLRRGGAGTSPALDLARLMKRLFEKRYADKTEMLHRVDAGKSIEGLDVCDGSGDEPAPASKAAPAPPAAPSKPAASKAAASTPPRKSSSASISVVPPKSNPPPLIELDSPSVIIAPPPPPAVPGFVALDTANMPFAPVTPMAVAGVPAKKSSFAILLAGGALVLVLGAAALALGFRNGAASSQVPARPSASAPTSAALASAATMPSTPSTPSAPATPDPAAPAASVAAGAADSAAATTAEAPIEEVLLHIDTVPSRAPIFVAGNKMGVSPLDMRVPKRTTAFTLEIRHPGYQTLKERVVPDVNQRLKLTLVPAAAAPSPTTAASAPYHKFQ
jgi:serine/threonine-protein kinase